MQPFRTRFARALARLTMRNPERLWLHYGFALSLVFALILTAYWLNGTVIDRGAAAAESVRSSNEQALLAQDVLRLASVPEAEQSDSFRSLSKAIVRLEAMHQLLTTQHERSPQLTALYFDKDRQFFARMSEFIELAKLVVNGVPEIRSEAVWRMHNLYDTGGIQRDLVLTATYFATLVEEEAAYFSAVQSALFWASALVLFAEAIFVFWPAQHAVQTTILKMRRQTTVLRASQSRLKAMNRQLEHIVQHDQLTGLPNRTSLVNYLDDAIIRRLVDEAQLYLVGLDRFKAINDMVGHEYGDALLVEISRALRRCIDYDDVVAHVGGDTFVLISRERKDAVLRRIVAALDEPFTIKGRCVPINASVGYLTIGTLLRKPLDIVADAEIALQCAKNEGGNRAIEFTASLRDGVQLVQELELALPDAIESGQIEPWFQPQVRLADGKLHGVEVLARWRHPTRGLLTPDKFLPAAERAGLMVDLDHAVWKSAMRHAYGWQSANLWHPVISLNAAPVTIGDPYLVERFLLALQRSGLGAEQVVMEVLETTLINGKDDIAAINIDTLAESGIALELDDFGTGYASLSKLIQLPLTGIKLDRSLIAPLPDHAADSVVRAILALAAELGLHVVAEGVEEMTQAQHLCNRGCSIGQGYEFGRPMPPDAFTAWLHNNSIMVPDMPQETLRA